MNHSSVQRILRHNVEVQKRVSTLLKASEINPDFRNPYITGGMLRDIILGGEPRDCDVVFEGIKKNQEGVLEAIQEAEITLGIEPFPNWEIENTFAHGPTRDIVENTIGLYSHHTDFLTLLMYNGKDEMHIGDERTLPHIEKRIYDPRFLGMLNWIGLRDRTYDEEMAGDAQRGLYLVHRLHLHPTPAAEILFRRYDYHFDRLTPEQQQQRRDQWVRKTASLPEAESILKRYGVTSLSS